MGLASGRILSQLVDMLEEAEAKERIFGSVPEGVVTWVPLELAIDLVLAQAVEGVLDSPPFDNSSMDGYAVRSSEAGTGARLSVLEESQAAGVDRRLHVAQGGAVRIFTGAPLPEGADAVVMQEDVERVGTEIHILEGVLAGENIRRRGCDVCAGQHLLDAGVVLGPTQLGLLASQGLPEVPVYRRPLVEIITTGDELVPPGEPLGSGLIYNSNSTMLQAAVTRLGAVAAARQVADDPATLALALGRALATADLVVVAGGVSVGERDYVREVLVGLGVAVDFWKIRIKPGKPFLFGRSVEGTLVFGLPGNPVSAYVTFMLLVAPCIERLLGRGTSPTPMLGAIAAEPMENPGDRPHYLRARVEQGRVKLSGLQQSHAIFGLSRANCLVRLGPDERLAEGDPVEIVSM